MNALGRGLMTLWWSVASPLPPPARLVLAVLLLNLPLFVASEVALRQVDDDIAFSRLELQGTSLIRPAIDLMQVVQRHRGASQLAAAGSPLAKARIATLRTEVGSRLDGLNTLTQTSLEAAPSSITGAIGAINQSWTAVIQHQPDPSDTGFAANSRMITDLILWQQTVAEETGIVLDADPFSYHLSQALMFQIPNWIESTAQSRGLGAEALARRALTPEQRAVLFDLEQRQKHRQDAVVHELDRAAEHRPELRTALQPILFGAMDSDREFLAILHRDVLDPEGLDPEGLHTDAEAFYEQGSHAVDQLFSLAHAGYQRFEAIVEARLRAQRLERALVLVADAAGILLVTLALAGTFRMTGQTPLQSNPVD